MIPENAEESFKCSKCGLLFSRGRENSKKCPVCGHLCTLNTCSSLGASNEEY